MYENFRNLINENTRVLLSKPENELFELDVDKDKCWEIYLENIDPEENKIFREKRTYDCSTCRQFIKSMIGLVWINPETLERKTIFDDILDETPEVFKKTVEELVKYLKRRPILKLFYRKEGGYGSLENRALINEQVVTFKHYYVKIPRNLTSSRRYDLAVQSKEMFGILSRMIEEISIESLEIIQELIEQGSLYRGQQYKKQVDDALEFLKKVSSIKNKQKKDNFIWLQVTNFGLVTFKNSSIGTLAKDITSGMELEEAVKLYENKVAPSNYRRSKSIITKSMVERARKELENLGLEKSIYRRLATLDDLNVNNSLFIDRTIARIDEQDPWEELVQESKKNFDFSRVEEITMEKFIQDILPKTKKLEVFLSPEIANKFVALTGPKYPDAPSLFKWSNPYAWSYKGNVADSEIKKKVQDAGGEVNVPLRVSLAWQYRDDLDLHVVEEKSGEKTEIYYGRKQSPMTDGYLDVDMNVEGETDDAVENVRWKNIPVGYKLHVVVHNFKERESKPGFTIEIQIYDKITRFYYPHKLPDNWKVHICTIHVNSKNDIKIIQVSKDCQKTDAIVSQEIWGLKVNNFYEVCAVTKSPNYWNDQVGYLHYFFFIKGSRPDEPVRGFYNEFLKEELFKHRKTFEILAGKVAIQPEEFPENPLCGLGFAVDNKTEFYVRVQGAFTRTLKIRI